MQQTKFLFAVTAACLSTGFAAAQDECASALPVTPGVNEPFDTATATPSAEPWACTANVMNDVWYTFTAADSYVATISTCNMANYDTRIEVFDGDCGALNSLACNDDAPGCAGFTSEASVLLSAGTQYWVRVGGFNAGATGQGDLFVEGPPPPPDECVDAVSVLPGVPQSFDTTLGTPSAEAWSCTANAMNDLWYTFTATDTYSATASTCGTANFDTRIEVFDGDCGALNSLACNDDAPGCAGFTSIAEFTAVSGTTYFVRVGGFNASSAGQGDLLISEPPAVAPNDECVDAIALGEGISGPFSTNPATVSSAFACGNGGGPDIWFTYRPSFNGDFTISLCGSDYDTAMELFEGDCGSLTLLECNDDSCGLQSAITHCGVAGTTYTFRVGGWNGNTGVAQVDISNSGAETVAQTIFDGGNGLGAGGAVYFDGTFTQDCPVATLAVNTGDGAGLPVTVEVYTNPAGYAGNEQDPTGWTLLGTASGLASDINVPSVLTPDAPMTFLAGTTGIAIVYTNTGVRYTNGNGTNETAASPDGVISLSLGTSGAPFAAPTFSPRIWNGWIERDVTIGTSYCPQPLNSVGLVSTLQARGSDVAADDCIYLIATNLPQDSFGYFICGQAQAMIPAFGGFLCIGGDIGRGVGGAILNSGAAGAFLTESSLDLPQPLGSQQALAGETWNFQAICRDSFGGVATSTFTNAVSITFQ